MDDSHEWTVYQPRGNSVLVTADAWLVGPNGDLGFFNGSAHNPFFVRAYAAGTWTEVRLYA